MAYRSLQVQDYRGLRADDPWSALAQATAGLTRPAAVAYPFWDVFLDNQPPQ